MKYFLVALISFISVGLTAQEAVHLSIIGVNDGQGLKLSQNYIKIVFEENSKSCGPDALFEKLEEQVYHFEKSMKEAGLDFSMFKEEESLKSISTINNRFKILIAPYYDNDVAIKISKLAKDAFAEDVLYYTILEDKKLEDEDVRAISALNDAYRRAKILQKVLNKDHIEIVAIDDITNPVQLGLSKEPFFSLSGELKTSLYSIFNNAYRYSLRVHFKLM